MTRDQGDLFGSEPPFIRGSDTSEAAAEAIGEVSGRLRLQVYELLCEYASTGLTDHQQQEILQMNPSTQRPRRIELVDAGLVIDSGRRRPSPSGRPATVWIIKRKAEE